MDIIERLSLFSPYDLGAVGLLFAVWIGISVSIENAKAARLSMSMLMAEYRRDWMRQMVTRQPRIFDASILSNLRQSTAFFASASMIAIGGLLALIGNTERLIGVAGDLTLTSAPALVWEIKLLLVLFFMTNGFLKFVWSNRLFGYCAVVMAAVPNDVDDPLAEHRAGQAAEINITAARSFNRGLRSVYFAMASIAWLAGPVPLAIASVGTCLVLWRREFASQSRAVLLSGDAA